MRKNKFLLLVIFVSVIFFACKNSSTSSSNSSNDSYDVLSSNYQKITSNRISFSNVSGDAELYMFVYNTGDSAVDKSQYENILDLSMHRAAASEDFFVSNFSSGNVATIKSVTATCKFNNADSDCQIFVENDLSFSNDNVEKIAGKFSTICKAEQALLGSAKPEGIDNSIINNSQKITILVSNFGCTEDNMTFGYFSSNDLISGSTNSNGRMMIVLNSQTYSAKLGGEDVVYSTLAHEFNHLLNYVNKTLKHGQTLNTWFTEMLSAITEDFAPSYLGITNKAQNIQLPNFNIVPHIGMVNWNSDSYGFAYAFGAYLVRNYGGVELVRQLATNQYCNKEAVTKAMQTCGYNETYESALLKFGLVMANADGKDSNAPTLNKSVSGKIDNYTYTFPAINLYDFDSNFPPSYLAYFNNPNWTSGNHKGPCFFNCTSYPTTLYGNAFYAVYLGKARDWNYKLNFNPPSGNIQAYIYIRN